MTNKESVCAALLLMCLFAVAVLAVPDDSSA